MAERYRQAGKGINRQVGKGIKRQVVKHQEELQVWSAEGTGQGEQLASCNPRKAGELVECTKEVDCGFKGDQVKNQHRQEESTGTQKYMQVICKDRPCQPGYETLSTMPA
ncbi:hypothetical protein BY996DRAFT_6460649 [Phakopsora pachyrhizi]|nr:hypothetical protein BY996DRAFT_6460649 [Phakopsora pachyrhizi]